ncbi:MAG: outer membrane protein transport protein [Bryobacterales bacterium]|nr:outer membrane protein transport protein [Bryobacterales bacterium]
MFLGSGVPAAFGSAFAVNELGARAQGMGGAFTAIADDASALFFNPAGLAFQKGTNFQMEALAINGQFRFVPSDTPPGAVVPEKGFSGAIGQPFIPVASMYFSRRMSERWSLGFALYTPNGLAANFTNFNDGDPSHTKFVGRWAGSRAMLRQFWFQPTVAVRLSQNHAISVGVAAVHTHLFLEQSFLNPYEDPDEFGLRLAKDVFPGADPVAAYRSFARLLPEGRLRAAATSNRPGFAGGYLYRNPNSGFSLGLNYRSPVVSRLKGDAAFSFTNEGALVPFLPKDQTLDILFPNQPITGTFVTPATYVVGVAKNGVAGGTLAFDFRMQDFQRFRDIPLNFSQTVDANGEEIGTPPERRLVFDFRNSYLIHAGYERPFGSGGPMRKMLAGATWRAGYVFDYTPVVEKSVGPLFPDATRHSWTAGMTKPVGSFDMTFFYQFMQFMNRTTNVAANNFQFTNGEYRNFANLIGLGMRWRVGGHDGRME